MKAQVNGSITRQAAIDSFLRGEFLIIAEWRQCNVDELTLRDRKTGNARSSCVSRHGCETETGQLSVAEWHPDGTRRDQVSHNFVKGDTVAIQVRGLTIDRGGSVVNGTILKLVD